MLLSFHNDKKIKQKYVSRLKAHAKADEIIKGRYWQNGKGCAVGCTIHSGKHNAYETELGLPEWLARLEDILFEGLPNNVAKKFVVDFLLAIPIGKELKKVKWQFCNYILKENFKRVQELDISKDLMEQVSKAIRDSIDVNTTAIKTGQVNEEKRSAASAALSAVWSVESVKSAALNAALSAAKSALSAAKSVESVKSAALISESAAWSVESVKSAASAVWSVESVESAENAVWSVESVKSAANAVWSTRSAAASAAFKRYAKHLLKLLKEVK